jgi:hypothetical protein
VKNHQAAISPDQVMRHNNGAGSNLSGAPISGFTTFSASGWGGQLDVTAGLIYRF